MTIKSLLLLMLGSLCAAHAGTISNFGSPQSFDTADGWLVDGGQAQGQQVAVQFTSPVSVLLTNVELAVGILFSDLSQSPLSVSLNADSSGLPGADLSDLTLHGNMAAFPPSDFAFFLCSSCPTLQAGTPYWIVASIPDQDIDYFNSEVAWNWNNTLDYSNGANLAFNETQSATPGWQLGNNTELRPAFAVNAPEPGSLLLMAVCLAASFRKLRNPRR